MPSTAKLTSVAEVAGALKQVQQAFTAFQVARNEFVNSLSVFLNRSDPSNVTLEALMKNDVMAVLCCPLAQDSVPGIQAQALSCLAKLAAADPVLAQVVVSCGILDGVALSMSHESPPVQSAANAVLSSVAKSTQEYAHRVLAVGIMPGIMTQLSTGPAAVKEAAVKTLNSLVQSSEQHATIICDDQLLSVLVALLHNQDSPHSLCKAVINTLGSAASFNSALANKVVQAQALAPVCLMVRGASAPPDNKAAALTSLSLICKHDEQLAAKVAEAGVLQSAVQSLADKMTPAIRRAAAALLLQVVQKTPDLAEVVAGNGAPTCLNRYMQLEKGQEAGLYTGVMIAGSMSTFKDSIAKALIDAETSQSVIDCVRSRDPALARAAAWAVEQMASHGSETTAPLVQQGALQQLVEAYAGLGAQGMEQQPDLGARCKAAIKALIRGCEQTGPLENFVRDSTPPLLLKHLLRRLEPLLRAGAKARQQYVTSGALMRMQQVEELLCDKGRKHLADINALFPPDVVKYYRDQ